MDAPPTFSSVPANWAVIQGEYEYIPEVINTGNGPVTLTVIQKPTWLTFDGTRLFGTPPAADEGLNPLVILRATNGDGRQTDLSFRILIGRLVGPVTSPPGGGSTAFITGMPQLARSGGDTLLVTGVQRADEFPIFWGLRPDGIAMK
ncbi:MAG: hypothetical protein HC901_03320 [Bdellovibrionaceae bacterium]|nr:hypothetical protein [Pseudobdellovibrionaceae bacterium]